MLNFGTGVIRNYIDTDFTLTKFFSNQSSGAWYDLQDISTLYQDTAKTSPVTATGQSIALIADKSGFGHDVQISGTYAQPESGIYGIQYSDWPSLQTLLHNAVGTVANFIELNYTQGFFNSTSSGYLLASLYIPNTVSTSELDLIKSSYYNWSLPGQLTPGLFHPV